MKTVNYYIIGEIFGLLERIEVSDNIDFADFGPDDPTDANAIVERFVRPALEDTSDLKREKIRWTLEYYSSTDSAPFQLLKDRCQELTLADSDDWKLFFLKVGKDLFGDKFAFPANVVDYQEVLNEAVSQMIFVNS